MPGIDPTVAVHKFYIDPTFSPINQKKRLFNDEKNTTTREEDGWLTEVLAMRFSTSWMLPEDIIKFAWL
ncbi:hypothetical protein LIER_06069 [Lithospermum erythrorhizon]|uniref:Uncharacterized protein n=1 Tax=Lithospermum erythrorhizon TaxID=34254 RepID=A0AAV3P374_LITER